MAAASREYVAMFHIGAKLLGSFRGAMSQAQRRLRTLQLTARSITRGIAVMGAALAGLAIGTGIAAAGLLLRKVLTGAEEAYNEQLLINTQLTSVFSANAHIQKLGAGAAEKQVELLGKQAGELQKVGVVSDEVLLAGAKQLAIYGMSPKKISELMPVMGDVLATQKGVNATMADSQKVAVAIGKAVVGGQLMGMKKIAPALNQYTQKQWKALSAEQRRVKVAEALDKAYKGASETLGKTPIGTIKRAQLAFGELQERIGKIKSDLKVGFAQFLINLLPRLEPIVDRIGKAFGTLFGTVNAQGKAAGNIIADYLVKGLEKLAEFIEWLAANKDWVIPWVTNLAASFLKVSAAIWAISAATAISPLAWVAGAAVAVLLLATNFEEAKSALTNFADAAAQSESPTMQTLGAVAEGLEAWLETVGHIHDTIVENMTELVWNVMQAGESIKNVFVSIGEALKSAFLTAINLVKTAWENLKSSILSFKMPDIIGGIKSAAGKVGEFFTGGGAAAPVAQQFGGIHSRPTLATLAERGPEAVIPLSGGRRAEGLLNYAASALGMRGAGGTSLNFAPVINIAGNATETEQRAMDSRLRDLATDFIKQFSAAQEQERRLSYTSGYG